MREITEEDIDIFFNRDDPDFDQRLKEVMLKYLENAEIKCAVVKDSKVRWEWQEQLESVRYFLRFKNWLIEIPVETKIAFTKQALMQQEKERLRKFGVMLDTIGVMNRPEYGGEKYTINETGDAIAYSFDRVLEIQQNRAKKTGIRGFLTKIKKALHI